MSSHIKTIDDIKNLRGIESKRVLYVVTLHTFSSSNRYVNFAMNSIWNDAHPEVKQYLTHTLKFIANAQMAFLLPYEQCVILTCVIVPTFMNPHIQNGIMITKKFTHIVPFELIVSNNELEDTKKTLNLFNNIVCLKQIFSNNKYYNDIRVHHTDNWTKIISDLSRDSNKLKDSSLIYVISMSRMINAIFTRSEVMNLEFHKSLEIKKKRALVMPTIIDKIKKWSMRAKVKIKAKYYLIRAKMPNRIAPKNPSKKMEDEENTLKRRKNFTWCYWNEKRKNLIMHNYIHHDDYYSVRRTFIRCVDDGWLNSHKMNQNVKLIKKNATESDYLVARDRFIEIKPHLRGVCTNDEIFMIVMRGLNEEKINELKYRWIQLFF